MAIAGLLASASVQKASGEERAAVLAHMFPDTSLSGEIAQRFAEGVAEASNLSVRIIGRGVLGDERHNVRQMVLGDVDFAITGDLFIGVMLPNFQAMNLPFINTSFDAAANLHEISVRADLEKAMREFGLTVLSRHCIGQRFLTATRPIRTVQELKGLKLRLPPDPVWTRVWTALGAEVENIPFTDLKAALARGVVDAQENPTTLIRGAKLYEVQRYLILTRHYVQYQYILASSTVFDALSDDEQAAVKQAAEQASKWGCATAEAEQADELAWLVSEGGMIAVEFEADGARDTARSLKTDLPAVQAQSVLDALH